jgi:hypothetical protein
MTPLFQALIPLARGIQQVLDNLRSEEGADLRTEEGQDIVQESE